MVKNSMIILIDNEKAIKNLTCICDYKRLIINLYVKTNLVNRIYLSEIYQKLQT